ncbi:cAMP-independent regulatory protein pac2 [Hypsizygus marmoreus]|uniref:cAMP-independent regulatory protein pac2 n=1 Tax=Hypsizygus marmoreus TaxID=39966 RepID=A0A369JJA1_HYPMA|nr:cAMP-independent regulatory protein pac2 [Hypsizygus marmoreus]
MQQATHPRLHVRDAHDAHVVFEAVRQGFLRPVVRRLNDAERATIVRPGAIFVWIECEDDAGLKRWTDGRVWGQSRMREARVLQPYLFYDEKLPFDSLQGFDTAPRSPTYRFVDSAPRSGPSSSAISHQDRTAVQHPGLVKQAYSAWVSPNPRSKPQKWHLTAYFTYAELSTLPTIDKEPLLQKIIVPPGIYRSGNARSRSDEEVPTVRRPGSYTGLKENRMPLLPSLQSTIPEQHGGLMVQQRTMPARLPEDHRVIQMLNSKHIL